jgi:hypothetical protein
MFQVRLVAIDFPEDGLARGIEGAEGVLALGIMAGVKAAKACTRRMIST